MRKRIPVFAVIGLAVLLAPAVGQVVEEIVAVVNDDVITLSQVKEQFDATVQQLRSALQGAEYEAQYQLLKKDLLNMMITDLLLMQQAKEKNLNVSEQVKMAVENIKKENNIESDDDLKRGLQQQGLNFDEWIKQLEDNMLKQATIYSEVDRSIVLDDSEIVGYYKAHPEEFTESEEYHVRAVYLASEGKTPEALGETRALISGKVQGRGAVQRAGEGILRRPGQGGRRGPRPVPEGRIGQGPRAVGGQAQAGGDGRLGGDEERLVPPEARGEEGQPAEGVRRGQEGSRGKALYREEDRRSSRSTSKPSGKRATSRS